MLAIHFVGFQLSAQLPQLTSSDKKSPVEIKKLDADILVLGNRVNVTYTLTLYNPSDKVLEATFLLPLPDGAQVTRYALDIQGKLREAVPVEKQKATQVFESIEKRRVDPGLLEKTEANVFRTRVYPVPSKGQRQILISFEKELGFNAANELVLQLPFEYEGAIQEFNLNTVVQQHSPAPVLEASPVKGFSLSEQDGKFCGYIRSSEINLSGNLEIRIPKSKDQVETYVQSHNGDRYFYIQPFIPSSQRKKKLPSTLTVIWDNSLSGVYRDVDTEIKLLQAYLDTCSNVTVDLYTLNNSFKSHGRFSVRKGNSDKLINTLRDIPFDGGTDFSQLKEINTDEVLFFSDGISSLSDVQAIQTRGTVYTVNSSPRADFDQLRNISESQGGSMINLSSITVNEGLRQLCHESLLFLGIKNSEGVEEYFPAAGTQVFNSLTVSGKLRNDLQELTLLFGYGNKVILEKKVSLKETEHAASEWNLEKLMVQQKIRQLEKKHKSNEQIIRDLGKKYGIVTRNTSLMVLEDIMDYVRYDIEPPVELRQEYKRLLKERRSQSEDLRKDVLASAISSTEELWTWWNTRFPRKVKTKEKRTNSDQQVDTSVSVATGYGSVAFTPPSVAENEELKDVVPEETRIGEVQNEAELRVSNALSGKVLGVQLEEVVVRGMATLPSQTSSSRQSMENRLIVIDGKPSDRMPDQQLIETMETLEPRAAVSLYGSRAIHGVLFITTKSAKEKITTGHGQPEITLTAAVQGGEYLKRIRETAPKDQYDEYLILRDSNLLNPNFYYDMGNFFLSQNRELGIQIFSSLADLDIENHELSKLLAYKFKETGLWDLQEYMLKKVVQWRPQEPQSYRDYALALADNGKYQQALDALYLALTHLYENDIIDNYEGIEETIVMDINHILSQQQGKIKKDQIDNKLIRNMPVDIRVVLNWNMNDTDMDLWITDPDGEKCYYSNKITRTGGRISEDMTEGYGPEQFLLRKANKGKYKIHVDYYGESSVKIAGKTTLLLEIFTNYGRSNEERKLITLQVESGDREGIYVGEFNF